MASTAFARPVSMQVSGKAKLLNKQKETTGISKSSISGSNRLSSVQKSMVEHSLKEISRDRTVKRLATKIKEESSISNLENQIKNVDTKAEAKDIAMQLKGQLEKQGETNQLKSYISNQYSEEINTIAQSVRSAQGSFSGTSALSENSMSEGEEPAFLLSIIIAVILGVVIGVCFGFLASFLGIIVGLPIAGVLTFEIICFLLFGCIILPP